MFSGDTLFNAGVGNCRNGGNVHQLYRTIESIYDEFEDSLIKNYSEAVNGGLAML